MAPANEVLCQSGSAGRAINTGPPPLTVAESNAVKHAIGKRMYELPMSPRRILETMQES